MTSKVEQLFLELCLLRSRYSAGEIEKVSSLKVMKNDPSFRMLIAAMNELSLLLPGAPQKKRASSSEKLGQHIPGKPVGDPESYVAAFVAGLSKQRILRTRAALDDFSRAIGVSGNFEDRKEIIQAIRDKLERMPSAIAVQKVMSAYGRGASDSGPYVELARTLMKS